MGKRHHLWVSPCAVAVAWGILQLHAQCDGADRTVQRDIPVLEDLDSSRVRIRELWGVALGDSINPGGIAAWDDGTIWIANGSDESIWAMPAGGGALEPVRGHDEAPFDPQHSLAVARVPGGGLLIGSYRGVTVFEKRGGQGVFTGFPRQKITGLAVFENGDYVVSHGQYPNDPHVEYSIHRYELSGHHIASWHPAFLHDEWSIVTAFSGGPVAITRDGDVLFSELAPFRITRYVGGLGDSSMVIVEDETSVSSSEFDEAIVPDGSRYRTLGTKSVFVDEMEDGGILNVVRHGRRESRWIVVSPDGRIIARTRFDQAYWKISRSGPGRYLAIDGNGRVVELQVTLESGRRQ